MDDTRLGPLLLEGHMIGEEDLERCLEIQVLTGGSRPLGQILVEQNLITAEELEGLLEVQRDRRRSRSSGPALLTQTEIDALMGVGMDDDGGPPGIAAVGCEAYLAQAANAGASELVMTEGAPPMVLVADCYRVLEDEPVQSTDLWQFVRDHLGVRALEQLAERKSLCARFHRPGIARGRIVAFRHFGGASVTVRLQPEKARTGTAAGIDDRVLAAARAHRGLILVTGEVGSGISTTITALLHEVIRDGTKLVVVLDEDADSDLPRTDSVVLVRHVDGSRPEACGAIESAIRMNPDVLVIGDVSSPQAFDLAVRAAEAGHLVVAAMHARSTRHALQRAFDFYSATDVARLRATLASILTCVMRVHLVPSQDGHSMLLATEVLAVDAAAQSVIREAPIDHISLLLNMEGTSSGHSLDASLERLVQGGSVSVEHCFDVAENKSRFLKYKTGKPVGVEG